MTVYVDDARNKLGRMLMGHMISESLDELHQMAADIGMKREWFQDSENHPHYDVSVERRRRALALGAQQITSREAVRLLRVWRLRAEK